MLYISYISIKLKKITLDNKTHILDIVRLDILDNILTSDIICL